MDEFHYYADRDRGVAWQVPLLTMPQTRFLLMSATLGDTRFFEEAAHAPHRPRDGDRHSRAIAPCRSNSPTPRSRSPRRSRSSSTRAGRPSTSSISRRRTRPSSAQDFMSIKICTSERRRPRSRRALEGCAFGSPYGEGNPQVAPPRHRHAPRGAAAEVPHARRAARAEGTAQGHLRHGHARRRASTCRSARCSSRGSASSTARRRRILSARDFQQIAGRAGRKGFDDRGSVVAQAPEHVIENIRLSEKAGGDGKKVVKRKPPERDFVHWDRTRSSVDRGAARAARLAVPGLARHAAQRAEPARRRLPRDAAAASRDCHEPEGAKTAHSAPGVAAVPLARRERVVEFIPQTADGAKVRVNVDLQEDFSLDHALSLYLVDTLPLLDRERPTTRWTC